MQQFNLSNLPKYWMVRVDKEHPFFEDFNNIWESFNVVFSSTTYKYCGFDDSFCNKGYHGCDTVDRFHNNAVLLSMDDFERLVTPQFTLNYSIF